MRTYTVELESEQDADNPVEAVSAVLNAASNLTWRVTDDTGQSFYVENYKATETGEK
jgi:C4-type Zn-finger protein